jgi:hypothetical protein
MPKVNCEAIFASIFLKPNQRRVIRMRVPLVFNEKTAQKIGSPHMQEMAHSAR